MRPTEPTLQTWSTGISFQLQSLFSTLYPHTCFTLLRYSLLVHDCNPMSETLFIIPYVIVASPISCQLWMQATKHIGIIWPITFLRILSHVYHFRPFIHHLFSKPKSPKCGSSVGIGKTWLLSILQDTGRYGGRVLKIKSVDFRTGKALDCRLMLLVMAWTSIP